MVSPWQYALVYALLAAFLLTVVGILRAFNCRQVSERVQVLAGRLVGEDEEEDDGYEECLEEDTRVGFGKDGEPYEERLDTFTVPKAKRGRYVRKLALIAQAEFGLPQRTEANRLCVQRFLRDHMRSEKVRETHIATILPVAVGLTFVPNAGHVLDRELRAAQALREQVELVEGRLCGITPFERWTSWWRGTAPAKEVRFSK